MVPMISRLCRKTRQTNLKTWRNDPESHNTPQRRIGIVSNEASDQNSKEEGLSEICEEILFTNFIIVLKIHYHIVNIVVM